MITHTNDHTSPVPLSSTRVLHIHSGTDSNDRQGLGGAVVTLTDVLGRTGT